MGFFMGIYPRVIWYIANWKDPPCYWLGKIHDFDWAIFNSYVKLPEGTHCVSESSNQTQRDVPQKNLSSDTLPQFSLNLWIPNPENPGKSRENPQEIPRKPWKIPRKLRPKATVGNATSHQNPPPQGCQIRQVGRCHGHGASTIFYCWSSWYHGISG